MKNIKTVLFMVIALLLIFSLVGCGGPSRNLFNPPSWIQGTWKEATFGSETFVFTSDNIVYTTPSSSMDFKVLYKGQAVTESISDNAYTASIAGSVSYSFVKTSATTLDYSITASGITIGPRQFNKQ